MNAEAGCWFCSRILISMLTISGVILRWVLQPDLF